MRLVLGTVCVCKSTYADVGSCGRFCGLMAVYDVLGPVWPVFLGFSRVFEPVWL